MSYNMANEDVVELVDTPALGAGAAKRGGSSPLILTITMKCTEFVHQSHSAPARGAAHYAAPTPADCLLYLFQKELHNHDTPHSTI